MLLYRKFNLALKKDVCYLNPGPRPSAFQILSMFLLQATSWGVESWEQAVLLLLLNSFALFILDTFGLCCHGNSFCCLILWRIKQNYQPFPYRIYFFHSIYI